MPLQTRIQTWIKQGCPSGFLPRVEAKSNAKDNIACSQDFFESIIEINFRKQPELVEIFRILDKKTILEKLAAYKNIDVTTGKVLLHLDEIHDLSDFMQLQHFLKKELPDLPVMFATSLSQYHLTQLATPNKIIYFLGNSLNCTLKDTFPGHEICALLDRENGEFYDNLESAKKAALHLSYCMNKFNDEYTGPLKPGTPKTVKLLCYQHPIFEVAAGSEKCTRIFLPTKLNQRLDASSEYKELSYAVARYDGLTSGSLWYAKALTFWEEPATQKVEIIGTAVASTATAIYHLAKKSPGKP
jgi:hypothetical protein